MTTQVVDILCGGCGAPLQASQCGTCQAPARVTPLPLDGWRDQVVLAPAGPRVAAVALSLVPSLLVAALAVAAVRTRAVTLAPAIVGAVAVILILLGVQLIAFVRAGRGLGGSALGLRTVDARSGMPLAWLQLRTRANRMACDVRRGPDPLSPTGPMAIRPARAAQRPVEQTWTPQPATPTCWLVAGGHRTAVGSRLLVGRYPLRRPPGENGPVVEVTDLTRTMGRAHCVLEAEADGSVWITDLGSANGTLIYANGAPTAALVPHQRTRIAPETIFSCGQQVLLLESGEASR